MSTEAFFPPVFARLVDDAAVFPPGDLPLARAVPAHRGHRAAPYAPLVGALVVADRSLPELERLVRDDAEPLGVAVVVSGGAGTVAPAVRRVSAEPHLSLRGVEVALRDLDDLAGNARRVVAALDTEEGVQQEAAYVELPTPEGLPGHGWLAALDEVADAGLRLKLRTGGLTAESFPTSGTLAACIDAALDREVPFKCTAGLHHAVRHQDARTGFEHHGFLNLLLATQAAWDGAASDEVAARLDDADVERVRQAVLEAGDDLVRARRWFTSFGSCSVAEPVADLRTLGLLPVAGPDAV